MAPTVREQVLSVLGSGGDEVVLDYVIMCLEDEDFHLGPNGEEALEAFGPVLVDGCICKSESDAGEACSQLANLLGRDPPPKEVFRTLGGGPRSMGDTADLLLHPSERPDVSGMIQTPMGMDETSGSRATERDMVKAKKREEKEDKARLATMQAHMALVQQSVEGGCPIIVRNTGGGGSKDLHLENFSISNGGAELIQDASLTMAFGRRYGLIGRNGAGKSTLLRAMASHGIAGIPLNWQILHVEQEVAGDDTPVIEAVLACDVERTELMAEEAALMAHINAAGNSGNAAKAAAAAAAEKLRSLGLADKLPTDEAEAAARLEGVIKRLNEIDAHDAEPRAAAILAGLSFDADMQRRATRTFSGGWRMRVALARALFVQPDLLLLDEPTNHLDLHAVLWLEEYLCKWPKTVLVVSHAREFLNVVCTDIIHLHSNKLTHYRGNFSTFEKTVAERMRNQRKAAESVASKKQHMQSFVDRFRANAKRASMVQSRIKAIEKMADVQVMEADPDYQFDFPTPDDPPGPPILGFTDVSFAYPGGPTLFSDINFGLDLDSRAAVVGPNGIGKTTLLNLIAGLLVPVEGHVARNPRLRMAMFSQHHVDGLDLSLSPVRYMMKCFPSVKEQALRQHLGSFGVSGDLALQPMFTLSGGQKSRVAFAKVTWTKPHFLLLDEPSNHLDIDAVDALIMGLNTFKGGVLMVSHDQHLIEATVDELWAVEGGTITPFHGTFDDYKKRLRSL